MRLEAEGLFCCARCFEHAWLKEYVEKRSGKRGSCRYCGSRRAPLIPVADLSDQFTNLIKIYRPSGGLHGAPLWYVFQDNWSIFNDKVAESGAACDIINDVMMSSGTMTTATPR